MTNWPPVKAWTSISLICGCRHFVAINYGSRENKRWVNLVSVVDGNIAFCIDYDELENKALWLPGWKDLGIKKEGQSKSPNPFYKIESYKNMTCLHPSIDAGLSIDSDMTSYRPWFPLEDT